MPHIKHPVSNPAHGCALQLHLIGFVLCSKPELKTEQEVRFLNKLLELKSVHGRGQELYILVKGEGRHFCD